MSAAAVLALPVPELGITYPPLPTVLGISPHGILAGIGIAVGAWFLLRRLREAELSADDALTALTWGVPAGIAGARIDYLISHPGQFTSLTQALALWNGGLALFGGLIAGTLTAALILRRSDAPVLRVLDTAAPALPMAIAIGRIGDLLLTDHLGLPAHSRVALAYVVKTGYHLAPGFTPSPAVPPAAGETCNDLGHFYAGCAYQLTAAYDLLGAAALTVLLLWLARGPHQQGVALSVFGLWYGTQRLLLDFTRGIDERPVLGLTGTQLLALGLIAASSLALVRILGRPAAPPADAKANPNSRVR